MGFKYNAIVVALCATVSLLGYVRFDFNSLDVTASVCETPKVSKSGVDLLHLLVVIHHQSLLQGLHFLCNLCLGVPREAVPGVRVRDCALNIFVLFLGMLLSEVGESRLELQRLPEDPRALSALGIQLLLLLS